MTESKGSKEKTLVPVSSIIPREIGKLSDLESLDLSSNSLTGIITSELGNLTRLGSLGILEFDFIHHLLRSCLCSSLEF
ncbi:hypothetical protein L6452_09390 [Arctium lappa]|uniref:Uncharacterized protein n=1 Tax=Arctium lappa TaxID=4217 RepID=A0ACB9DJW5_ARCLA|nr:hypothetical protein L6452_09390 [Arctium lappa]